MQILYVTPTCKGGSFCMSLKKANVKEREPVAQTQQQQVKFLKGLVLPPLLTALVALSPLSTPPGMRSSSSDQAKVGLLMSHIGLHGKKLILHLNVWYDLDAMLVPGIPHMFSHGAVSLGGTIDAQKGNTLFGHACIGCHVGGGNIIQPGATLFLKDLQRNGVETEEEIYRITYYGKGRMPGFGEKCTPRGQCTFGVRLREDEIKLLAEFVKSQADQGWPDIENSEE
ncbi:hypothetical protein RJ639_023892 [Escallonia herrerae]|uniref:Cytochrome c-553 n=1 Tax=Escallonia herrerae TaxID=1293975 RepID=A0AA88V1P2_9ASTE|nr:hypothetical protein RJ639_023892 [Escallonia herrerae]